MLRLKLVFAAIFAALLAVACELPLVAPTPAGETPIPAEPTSAPTATYPSTAGDQADLIFHNGHLITMDPAESRAEALAVRGERILVVGADEEVLRHRGPGTQVIDLEGRTLMPGFVDTHSHVFFNPESVGESAETIQERLLEEGYTTITEMGMPLERARHLQALAEQGRLKMRVSAYLARTTNCGDPLGDWYLEIDRTVEEGARLHFPGIKAFADGGSCRAPAVSYEFASGVGDGDLFFTQAEMNAMVAEAEENGYQLAVHALGDRAVEQVLTAYEQALSDAANPLRHRIEHNAVVRPDLYELYDRTGVVATLFGTYPMCWVTDGESEFKYAAPEEYLDWEWPYRDLVEANPETVFAWHGDIPIFALEPFQHVYGLVTRTEMRPDGSLCQPPEAMADQVISVERTLQMMTREAAYALHRDAVGVLESGKLADLIVLSDDPLSVEPAALREIHVLLTLFDGGVAFCSDPASGLCPRPQSGDDPTQSSDQATPTDRTESPEETPAPGAELWVEGEGEPAERVLVNGVVLTMEDALPRAQAVAIDGAFIQALGSSESMESVIGPETAVIDLEGKVVLPGLIDGHSHRLGDFDQHHETRREAAQAALSQGWTTTSEHFASADRLESLVTMDEAGRLPIRVEAYLPVNLEHERFGDWYQEYEPGEWLSPHVRVAGVKLYVDACGRHGKALTEAYADEPGNRGELFWTQEELNEAVRRVHEAGFQLSAHTCGDRALDLILNALEAALDGASNSGPRHRVEHVMIMRDDQLDRMQDLELLAAVQLSFFHSDWTEEMETVLGPGRVEWVGRYRDLLDAGVFTLGSTDSPWGYGETGPAMKALSQAVTRIGEEGTAPADWQLDQRLTIEEALEFITIKAAHGFHREDSIGSLQPGKTSDLIVLNANPLTVTPEDLQDIQVLGAMVEGDWVYCGSGESTLCSQ